MAEDYAASLSKGARKVEQEASEEVRSLREQIAGLKDQIAEIASPEHIDEVVHENPYVLAGVALLAGIAIGSAMRR
jgi:ElaB/YqjD/DUF883 family membrane-anchored ribosome-binding protein